MAAATAGAGLAFAAARAGKAFAFARTALGTLALLRPVAVLPRPHLQCVLQRSSLQYLRFEFTAIGPPLPLRANEQLGPKHFFALFVMLHQNDPEPKTFNADSGGGRYRLVLSLPSCG